MPEYATKDQCDHLTGRVSVIEREVEGEKIVTRHILEQTRRNGDDIAALKTRMDRVEGKIDRLESDVSGLRRELPEIVTTAVREAFAEHKGG